MIKSEFQHIGKPVTPPVAFVMFATVFLIAVSLGSAALFGAGGVPSAVFALIAGVALRSLMVSYPHDLLGSCNVVTLMRAALASILAGAIFAQDVYPWVIFVIACIAFAMDGLDGWLARRSDLSSAFGARFDMETDAILSALLSIILIFSGRAGLEVLVLGFARYGFVALSLFLPALQNELRPSFRRKAICVIQIATLIILLCPITSVGLLSPLSFGAATLLIWSFAVDIRWLLRTPK